jgi:glycyl-tRNA synthetase beta chain
LAALAEQAARLAKADLVTEMVGEFPELQGVMGGYYARAEGLPDAVADAIRDHYKPVGQGDDVPTAPVTVAVSLADKLDTLFSFWFLDERPTGSKDPFALRRASLSILALCLENSTKLPIRTMLILALAAWIKLESPDSTYTVGEDGVSIRVSDLLVDEHWLRFKNRKETLTLGGLENRSVREELRFEISPSLILNTIGTFFADRLKVQQREAGVRHDLIDAVFALGGEDDLVRLLARVKALQSFVETPDGTNLLAGYKRAANILKKEAPDSVIPAKAGTHLPASHPDTGPEMDSRLRRNDEGGGSGGAAQTALSYTPEPAEAALITALDAAEPRAADAIGREDFEGAMSALATLRAPIDAFFETVTVNDADPDKRAARLALLARMRDAVHRVADFSKIAG